jgi:hypothetical protein
LWRKTLIWAIHHTRQKATSNRERPAAKSVSTLHPRSAFLCFRLFTAPILNGLAEGGGTPESAGLYEMERLWAEAKAEERSAG